MTKAINGVRMAEFRNSKQQCNTLTEQEKIKNMVEGHSTFWRIFREQLEKQGGNKNAITN